MSGSDTCEGSKFKCRRFQNHVARFREARWPRMVSRTAAGTMVASDMGLALGACSAFVHERTIGGCSWQCKINFHCAPSAPQSATIASMD